MTPLLMRFTSLIRFSNRLTGIKANNHCPKCGLLRVRIDNHISQFYEEKSTYPCRNHKVGSPDLEQMSPKRGPSSNISGYVSNDK